MVKYAVYLSLKERFPNEQVVVDDRSYEFDRYSGPVKLDSIFGLKYEKMDDYLTKEQLEERNSVFSVLNGLSDSAEAGYKHFEMIGNLTNKWGYKLYGQYGDDERGLISQKQYLIDKKLSRIKSTINEHFGNLGIVNILKKVYRKHKSYPDIIYTYVNSEKCIDSDYINEILIPGEDAYYYCHWEQYDYWFKNIGKMLIDIYKFPEFDNPMDIDLMGKISTRDSIAIHVRRSEAVSRNQQLFDDNYYSKSVNYLKQRTVNPIFVVFSFDMDWCRNNLETLGLNKSDEVVFVDWNKDEDFGGDKAVRDMQLMTKCTHNIMANSTFSFMGGLLNQNPNKIVCCSKDFGTEGFVQIK